MLNPFAKIRTVDPRSNTWWIRPQGHIYNNMKKEVCPFWTLPYDALHFKILEVMISYVTITITMDNTLKEENVHSSFWAED